MVDTIEVKLSYSGGFADKQQIDFYDVGQALIGFQRSLALTTHLILNGEIITQAPSLKGAHIFALPPEKGSWEFKATIVAAAAAIYALGTAPRDTPIGHLIWSAYDYAISEALGVHVDYDETLGQQYEKMRKRESAIEPVPQSKLDALVEKCEGAIEIMHRPIVRSNTADGARISSRFGGRQHHCRQVLNEETFEYIHVTRRSDTTSEYVGRVSSYNINTFKGRVFVAAENRPVPFELAASARDPRSINCITESLMANAQARHQARGDIRCTAFRNDSKSGRLKSLLIVEVSK